MSKSNPIVAICGTRRAAAETAAVIRQAGLAVRKIAIIENEYPSREAAARIKHWPVLGSAWVTPGCLNAIGGGLESLGIPNGDLHRCRAALNENRIIVVVQGTPEEVVRARQACRVTRRRARTGEGAPRP